MIDTNRVLYDYIIKEYGSITKITESGVSLIDLNAVLLKENVSKEIGIGLYLFEILNIDTGEIVFNGRIKEIPGKNEFAGYEYEYPAGDKLNKLDKLNNSDINAAKDEIYGKCIRLSEKEKKSVLDYIRNIAN